MNALALTLLLLPAQPSTVDLPRFPSISPDGSTVTFSWRGDLWSVPSGGGTATRLTVHPADDLFSTWNPDGTHIAFTSTRNGGPNIWTMTSDGGDVRRVTEIDRPGRVTAFTDDAVYFHANLEGDVFRDNRPYVATLDGTPFTRVHDAFGSEPVPSADGSRVLFSRGGYYDGWDRRHYRGPENADVWIHDVNNDTFKALTTWNGNDGHAKWSGPRTVLFLSDRDDRTVNLYQMSAEDGEDKLVRLTDFTDRDVQWFDVSADGRTVVLHKWDALYLLDLQDPGSAPQRIAIDAATDGLSTFDVKSVNRDVSEAALSPDGKTCAIISYGEVFVRSVDDDAPTRRVTHSESHEKDLAWSVDGERLFFTSDRDGTESIYAATVLATKGEIREAFGEATGIESGVIDLGTPAEEEDADAEADEAGDADAEGDTEAADADADATDETEEETEEEVDHGARWADAIRFEIEPLITRETNDREAAPSPDGKKLAFRSTRGRIDVLDFESGDITTVRDGWDLFMTFRWSPDSQWISMAESDLNFNSDIVLYPADGSGEKVNITRHPDNEGSPRWSADGRILAFVSDRVNDEFDVWMVFLDADLEALSDEELAAYFDEQKKAAKKRKPGPIEMEPLELDLDDAWLRLRRVTRNEGNEGNLELTPGGDRIIFSVSGDDSGLRSVNWQNEEEKSLGSGSVQQVSLTGDKVVLVRSSQAATVAPTGGEAKTLGINARLRIDLAKQSSQKFLEAARGLGEGYYHPTMNGTDWPQLTEDYHELAARARTNNEFLEIANRFIGELNGSHLAVRGGAGADSGPSESYGRLGTIGTDLADGGYRVDDIVPQTPAATGPMALRAGDVIRAVDFERLEAGDTLLVALRGKSGQETVVTIERDGAELDVLLTPISYNAFRQLRYNAWRLDNARLVDEWSNGRLGYIHVQGMSQPSLDVFERDLYAAADGKDGLVLDVRNNGGGWTTDRLLSSIMVVPHAWTVPRGVDWDVKGYYPQDRLFIQRYTMPMNLLCNEKSYSNAEIMSHAFKTLKRGTLVGQQTHGSVISTGGFPLIDGTFVRLPFRGWFVADDGRDMELNGAIPDLLIPQIPADEAAGNDAQLRTAVEDLLKRLD